MRHCVVNELLIINGTDERHGPYAVLIRAEYFSAKIQKIIISATNRKQIFTIML